MKSVLAVFFSFFVLYLATMPPALAPYRDTGEMTVSAQTLGISHPPGYPLYIMLGHLVQKAPLGNGAYRLTLLSVLAGAGAMAVLFAVCRSFWGAGAALCVILLFGLNSTFWSVCLVPEMYSLWVLGAVVLAGLALNLRQRYGERLWLGFAGLYGLLLANRLDLLLWAPGLLWVALAKDDFDGSSYKKTGLWMFLAFLLFPALMVVRDSNSPIVPLIVGTALWLCPGPRFSWALRSMAMAALGLLAYLYLPIRSAQGPWLDWNHPAVFSNLMESLLRTKYGGTLDLLSKNYAKGELFGANLKMYAGHLWQNFSLLGLAAAAWGCAWGARKNFQRWTGLAAMYWWSGPVFLFMANMPPNPHAAAIVEPHYLLSDLVLALWAAEGFGALLASRGKLMAAAVLIVSASVYSGRWAQQDRRDHFFSYDYVKNVFRCVPPGGTLIAKKDVQLYSLWHYQLVQGWRPDIRVIAQGLASASWYQAGWRKRDAGLTLGPMKTTDQWKQFLTLNGVLHATMDAEIPMGMPSLNQRGLVSVVSPAEGRKPSALELAQDEAVWELVARRGHYSYEGQPDFFTSDLVDAYAQAHYRRGTQVYIAQAVDGAIAHLVSAWSLHWFFPEPSVFLGYVELNRGHWAQAQRYYELSVLIYDATLKLTEEYHSLAELKESIRRLSAEAHMHLGVTAERLGDKPGAEAFYRRSLAIYPIAQTHFNLAVLFWNRDWGQVERELGEALRLDPGHQEAAKYLAILRSKNE